MAQVGLRGSDVVGRPVVEADTGEPLDRVSDLVYDHRSGQIVAFVVGASGWFAGATVVPLEAVRLIGPDAVVVDGRAAVVEATRLPTVRPLLSRSLLAGIRVLTTDGRDLGVLADVHFDPPTGVVLGFETEGGPLADAATGRSFLPVPASMSIGDGVAFVPPGTVELVERARAGEHLDRAGRMVTSSMAAMAVDSTTMRDFVVGRSAEEDVPGTVGEILVVRGEPVTPEIARRAAELDLLGRLYLATGGSLTGAPPAEDVAADLPAAEAVLGRPVTRAILDRRGRPILDVGEPVTRAAIERAREAGELEALLRSVDRGAAGAHGLSGAAAPARPEGAGS